MRIVIIISFGLLTACKSTYLRSGRPSEFIIEFSTEQACDRGYTLITGEAFFSSEGSILKDTCNIPFTEFLQTAKASYIPSINDILNFERKIKGNALFKYYRLYSGFITHENEKILEVVMLHPSVIRKKGDSWKSERYQVGASHPFPKNRDQTKTVFYFSLVQERLIENSEILKYKLIN
jgi:hypothetical protein